MTVIIGTVVVKETLVTVLAVLKIVTVVKEVSAETVVTVTKSHIQGTTQPLVVCK